MDKTLRRQQQSSAEIERKRHQEAIQTQVETPADAAEGPPRAAGIVVRLERGVCIVENGADRIECRSIPGVAIGDRVQYKDGKVFSILPRRTVLSRPDPQNPALERVLAANIDVAVHVVSVVAPPLRAGIVDRYLIAIARGGADPLLCVNKMDLGPSDEELRTIEIYKKIGVRTVPCSAATGEGMEALRGAIAGMTCVFTGHSGVGKSSIVNCLAPGLALTTGEAGKKGRHTTTSSSLHILESGARLIDTPGVREFGLWQIRGSDLAGYFPEFAEPAEACAFRDCTHVHEPACAVRAAPPPRYEMYRRILKTMDERTEPGNG